MNMYTYNLAEREKMKNEKKNKSTNNVIPSLHFLPSFSRSLSLSLSLSFSSSFRSPVVSHDSIHGWLSLVVDVTHRENRKAQGRCDD